MTTYLVKIEIALPASGKVYRKTKVVHSAEEVERIKNELLEVDADGYPARVEVEELKPPQVSAPLPPCLDPQASMIPLRKVPRTVMWQILEKGGVA